MTGVSGNNLDINIPTKLVWRILYNNQSIISIFSVEQRTPNNEQLIIYLAYLVKSRQVFINIYLFRARFVLHYKARVLQRHYFTEEFLFLV